MRAKNPFKNFFTLSSPERPMINNKELIHENKHTYPYFKIKFNLLVFLKIID
jgi:hypothetical protein